MAINLNINPQYDFIPSSFYAEVEMAVSQENDAIDQTIEKFSKTMDYSQVLEVRHTANLLKSKLISMAKAGSSAAEIREASNIGLSDIQIIASNFSERTTAAHNKIGHCQSKLEGIENKISRHEVPKGGNFSFDDPSNFEILKWCPEYWEQRADMKGLTAVAQGVYAVAGYVVEGMKGVGNEFGANVQRQARIICNENPLIQKRCQQIKNFPSTMSGAIDSAGMSIEKKVTDYCTKNPDNERKCQTALNFAERFAEAVTASEPELRSLSVLIVDENEKTSK